jgi:putative transcriptional regulator
MSKKEILATGKILIAEPFLKDEYFIRSVIILADYNNDGAYGFIFNRTLDLDVNEALENFPDLNSSVFLGGPVARDNVFYIHTYGDIIEGSQKIMEGLYWGGDFYQLKQKIEEGTIREENIRFLAGYAGWDHGQLEKEIKEKSWIITHTTPQILLNTNPELLWKKLLNDMGNEFAQMANYPIDPNLN